MAEQAQLSGPDLTAGVEASTLSPGEKVLGHANGEAVLLTRVGDDYVAIGASCTHYGGPLAEGLIDGETVRCPWHHACFSLRTGEALEAPALSPVACWKVERRGSRVVVTEKVERDPLSPTYPITARATPATVVILGGGAAGNAAAEMLRRCGYKGRVLVIDDDNGSPYDRPNLSKDYLAGNAPEEWIPLRPEKFHEEHGIETVHAKATRIDIAGKAVELEGRAPIHYDALLLATGAEPIRLTIPGSDLPHVHVLRTLVDSRAIIEAAKTAKHAVVIGSSFIGLEVAASLRTRNVPVDVVAPEDVPLGRVLGQHFGKFIRAFHEEHGVTFHLGRKPQQIDATSVVLDDGSRLTADLVVMGVGVRPRLQLAEQAGLTLDRGVVVNEYLETSSPGIFAAGDIARWPDPYSGESIRVEHWVVAERQGQTAARNILGAKEKFREVPFFWSAHYDVSINYVGHAEKWDTEKLEGDASKKDASVSLDRGGKSEAFVSLFRDLESLEWEARRGSSSHGKA